MKFVTLALAALFSFQLHALQFMKCGSREGKTFWASFGKIVKSGETEPTWFPIDFTLLNGEKSLQDRIYFYSTKEALKVPLAVSASSIELSFAALGRDGKTPQTEQFQLKLYSPKDMTGFVGTWKSFDPANDLIESVQVMCSVL